MIQNKARLYFYSCFLFTTLTHIAIGQTVSEKADQITTAIVQLHNDGLFNGSILVAEKNEIIYKGSHGYADYESKRSLDNDSQFYLASVSKEFTTMAVMILVEDGKLNLDDRLSKYFPKFPDYADEVTIAQMMQHTSGVPNHYRLGIYAPGLDNDEVLHTLINQANLDFNPGEKYSYSNGAYVLLAMIVEKVSGQPFHEFMEDEIFGPLEMENTLVYHQESGEIENRALGHDPFFGKDDYDIYTTGAGGLYSTIGDIHKWDRALYTEKLVSTEMLDRAFEAAVLNDGSTSNYGFGWRLDGQDEGRRIVRHGGSLNGFRTQIFRDLDKERLIVVLTNHTNLVTGSIVEAIDGLLEGQSPSFPTKEDQYAFYSSNPNIMIQVLYAVISGDAGQERDWELFEYLFAPGAQLIPTRKDTDGQLVPGYMSPGDYVNNSGAYLVENGFFEKEIHRVVQDFGNIRHVFSTYESYRSSADKEPFARGINSIQMLYDSERWWFINIFWQGESEDHPIPERYLPAQDE